MYYTDLTNNVHKYLHSNTGLDRHSRSLGIHRDFKLKVKCKLRVHQLQIIFMFTMSNSEKAQYDTDQQLM